MKNIESRKHALISTTPWPQRLFLTKYKLIFYLLLFLRSSYLLPYNQVRYVNSAKQELFKVTLKINGKKTETKKQRQRKQTETRFFKKYFFSNKNNIILFLTISESLATSSFLFRIKLHNWSSGRGRRGNPSLWPCYINGNFLDGNVWTMMCPHLMCLLIQLLIKDKSIYY